MQNECTVTDVIETSSHFGLRILRTEINMQQNSSGILWYVDQP